MIFRIGIVFHFRRKRLLISHMRALLTISARCPNTYTWYQGLPCIAVQSFDNFTQQIDKIGTPRGVAQCEAAFCQHRNILSIKGYN